MLQMAWPLSQNGQVDRQHSTHQPLACQIVQHKNTLCCFLFQQKCDIYDIQVSTSATSKNIQKILSLARSPSSPWNHHQGAAA